MPKITLKSVVCFFRNLRSYISGWRNMVYTHSNAGNVNFLGNNQLFKQFRRILFCVLCLLGLTPMSSVRAANECDSFLSCCDTGKNCRQFYLGGIVGADFGTLNKVPGNSTVVPNDSLFTAGGTVGMRYLRNDGAWRFEFEGRGREQIQERVIDPSVGGADITTAARDGWSTMVNIWRDYNVVESVDLYAGGGIGAGGYRSVFNATQAGTTQVASNENVSNFAWQAGGGLIYNASNHIAVDLGYRFFSINDMTANGIAFGSPFIYPTNYAASELLLTVRIYEPFRRWR